MGTVEIDNDALRGAVSKVDALAISIGTQRAAAQRATPIELPSLADGAESTHVVTWLNDHKAEPLQLVLGLGILLGRCADKNTATS